MKRHDFRRAETVADQVGLSEEIRIYVESAWREFARALGVEGSNAEVLRDLILQGGQFQVLPPGHFFLHDDNGNVVAAIHDAFSVSVALRDAMRGISYRCPMCNSAEIQMADWVYVNTGFSTRDEPPNDEYFCPNCQSHFNNPIEIGLPYHVRDEPVLTEEQSREGGVVLRREHVERVDPSQWLWPHEYFMVLPPRDNH